MECHVMEGIIRLRRLLHKKDFGKMPNLLTQQPSNAYIRGE